MRVEWKTGPSLDAVEREIRSRILQERSNLPEMILTQVQAGGKRVRPTLALRGVEVCGGEITDRAIRAAASVEMVHVGSLIHDDIMDLALTRRGVPTINATDGMSHALVAGDLILGIAGECAISVSAEVGGAIARALVDLSVGQQLETESLFHAERTEDAYYRSVRGKTGSLLAVAASIGAMAEDVDPEAVQALAAYGMEFGLAFQILDDLLDVVSTEELFSKPVHNDFRVGVVNYPTMLAWAEGDFVDFQPLFEDRHASDRDRCEGSDRLVRELFTSPYVHRAEDTARGHAAAARDALLALGSDAPEMVEFAAYPMRYIEEQLARMDVRTRP